jgi:hypothetical protein
MGLAKDPDASDRTHDEHEAMCRRCGMSCHFAVPVNGLAVVIDALRCKFLGRAEDGRYQCTVYERRFEVAPWCHTAEQALAAGFLAQDCPYARGVAGYRGKARLSPSLLQKVQPALRAEVARAGVPIGADPEAALSFVAEAGGRWSYSVSEDGTRYLFHREDQAKGDPAESAPPAPPREPSKLRVIS